MLVFIDESGDAGFKVDKGSSPIFVVAMAIFDQDEHAKHAQSCIDACANDCNLGRSEFKFNKCSFELRDKFFAAVSDCTFKVRAIVVRKEIIFSPRLKAEKENFYEFFVKKMMQHDNDTLQNAKVIIDGSGEREFRRNLNTQLRRRLAKGAVKDIRFRDSQSDRLVQLADMCAGAIARSYRTDRDHPKRWRTMLRSKIHDVWDFG
jgi:hypothetical protein